MPNNEKINEQLSEQLIIKKQINETETKSVKALQGLRSVTAELGLTIKDISQTITGINLTGLGRTIFKDLVESNKQLTRISVNAGKGAQGAKELLNNVTSLQKGFGATREEAKKLYGYLSDNQYIGNIKEAAEASYQLARATGQSVESTGELTIQLSKSAGLSEKAITSIYASQLKIQHANGITKKGMQALNTYTAKAAENMKTFGKSSEAIKAMAGNTAKLVSSMEKVGISAETALGYIEKLTDPTRIEENIGLYTQLGISMSDALSGEDISGQVAEGMKELGEKLKEMGPIAGAQYAKAFGVSYKDAIKAANLEEVAAEATTPEDKAAEALKQLTEETKAPLEKVADTFQKLLGMAYDLGPIFAGAIAIGGMLLTRVLTAAITKIFNHSDKKIKETSKSIKKTSDEGLKEALSNLKEEEKAIEKKYDLMEKSGLDANNEVRKFYLKQLDEIAKKRKEIADEICKREIDKIKKIKEKQLEPLKGGGDLLKDDVRKVKGKIGGAWKSGVEKAGSVKSKLGGMFNKETFKDVTKGISRGIYKGTKGLVKGMAKFGGPLLIIGGLLQKVLGPAMEKLTEKAGQLLEPLQDVLGPVIDSFIPILNDLKEPLNDIFEVIKDVLGTLFKALKPVFSIFKTVLPLIGTILKILKVPITIIGVILQVLAPILNTLVKIIDIMLQPLTWIGDFFGGKGGESIEAVPGAIQENTEAQQDKAQTITVSTDGKLMSDDGVRTTSSTEAAKSESKSINSSSNSGVDAKKQNYTNSVVSDFVSNFKTMMNEIGTESFRRFENYFNTKFEEVQRAAEVSGGSYLTATGNFNYSSN